MQDQDVPDDQEQQRKRKNNRWLYIILARLLTLANKYYNLSANFVIAYAAANLVKITGGSVVIKVVSVGSVSLFIGFLVESVQNWWVLTPTLFLSTWSRISCAIGVIVVGRIFYLLRSYRPAYYAVIEMSAAVVTAYLAAVKISKAQESLAGLFALLSAVYLAVRAYDNFDKKPKPFEARTLHKALKTASRLMRRKRRSRKQI